MALSKSVVIFFMFLNKYCYGGKDCTISDILLDQLEKGMYAFNAGQRLEVTHSLISSSRPNYYMVTELAYYDYCLGFTTETLDTIVLDCLGKNKERDGCFQVLTPKFNPRNNTVVFTEKEERVCVSKLDSSCVGLKIDDGITIALTCRYSMNIGPYSGVPYSVTGSIPLNSRPPRV